VAAGVVALIAAMRMAGVRARVAYVVAGVALWLALHGSGLHATLAGVVLGLLTPTRPARQPELIDAAALTDVSSVTAARETAALAREAVSEVEWLEHSLHPWTGFVVVPLFALANAGIVINGGHGARRRLIAGRRGRGGGAGGGQAVGDHRRGPGSPSACAWPGCPAVRRGAALVPVACLAGIGFTVSILVAGLAFGDPAKVEVAKLAILSASALAAVAGSTLVVLGARDRPRGRPAEEPGLGGARRPSRCGLRDGSRQTSATNADAPATVQAHQVSRWYCVASRPGSMATTAAPTAKAHGGQQGQEALPGHAEQHQDSTRGHLDGGQQRGVVDAEHGGDRLVPRAVQIATDQGDDADAGQDGTTDDGEHVADVERAMDALTAHTARTLGHGRAVAGVGAVVGP
jgi:hypothetical protein